VTDEATYQKRLVQLKDGEWPVETPDDPLGTPPFHPDRPDGSQSTNSLAPTDPW
jgi:hypothetical protein